ncbi:dehydrogenase [Bacillus sp. AFS076308]|uniref:GMC family oxidoreductase n=1 Tax=unclassified Bacillus (in: firmicutes) TaxID=185979 RepID=UPI000BF64039|nr:MULTISPECIES: GMC family oxidoreductase [unclassified Bacillus (in: firmicutes)]PFN99250.1 dehydrogenase [Bacillus sp. AFS076308]PGV49161.1 dehydrogenase [Bacillus sp. AFS037270]
MINSSINTFDFIVVGTGPAGAVIGKTLTDDKKTSALVLEAGENNDKDQPISDSRFAPELEEQFYPQYFWQGEGIPQPGVDNRSFEWTTGRLSGGGSSINGEQYVRPTPSVLREWEMLLGPLWSPEQAIENFKQLENFHGKTNSPEFHGFNGRLNIRQTPKIPPSMTKKLVSAMEQATGFNKILDYNDPRTPIGPFTRWQLFQKNNGQRESSSTAFLSSDLMTPDGFGVNGRKLRVLYKSTSLRILFNGQTAIGIEFLKEGKKVKAFARKKVIISAGINSAQLLMLSGIGPANDLLQVGIPVVFDNPNVGEFLTNHTLNTATFTVNQKDVSELQRDPFALYTGGAFLPNPLSGINDRRRGVQLIGIFSEGNLTIAILFLQPKSRGAIKIQSNDPLKILLADEGFLDNRYDLEAIKAIYKTYIKGIAEKLSSIDRNYKLINPTLEMIENDDELEEFIKENFGHNHHQQSSLRMAPFNRGGVVDRFGNVHGVDNLIVADASIIPFTVDGNTSASAYLIGYTIAKHLTE